MSNIEKLKNHFNFGVKIFGNTVYDLSKSQGFYGRLMERINELESDGLSELVKVLMEQRFSDSVDVVLWLEQ